MILERVVWAEQDMKQIRHAAASGCASSFDCFDAAMLLYKNIAHYLLLSGMFDRGPPKTRVPIPISTMKLVALRPL